jgi:hypothetical protein
MGYVKRDAATYLDRADGWRFADEKSAYDAIDPAFRESHPQIDTVLEAWQPENIYLRPKLENFYYIEQILINSLHQMIEDDLDPADVAQSIYQQIMSERE